MSVKKRLQNELHDVYFSTEAKENLKRKIRLTIAEQNKTIEFREKLVNFWNGSTEIPVPLGVIMLGLIGLGLWDVYATLFVVDQATAISLLQVGSESIRPINQGVSIL